MSEYAGLLPHVLQMLLDILVVRLQHHIGGAAQIVQHVAVIHDILARVGHSLQTGGWDGFLCRLVILLMLLHQHMLDLYGEIGEVTYILDVIEEVMLAENILDIDGLRVYYANWQGPRLLLAISIVFIGLESYQLCFPNARI